MSNSNHGGARPGSGRKKGTKLNIEHKTGRIVISCLESEEAEIRSRAEAAGMNVSRYIIETLLK